MTAVVESTVFLHQCMHIYITYVSIIYMYMHMYMAIWTTYMDLYMSSLLTTKGLAKQPVFILAKSTCTKIGC